LAIAVVALIWDRGLDASEHRERGYLIRNASFVLTMDPSLGDRSLSDGPSLGLLKDADVLIVGDQVAAVRRLLRPPAGGAMIDGRGMIVMPGFVDTHDHLWQSIIRGCGTDGTVSSWFNQCRFPLLGTQLTGSDAYAAVRLSTTGLISTGVTTVVDWSHAFNAGFVDGNLRALNESGLRYVFAPDVTDFPDIKAVKAKLIDPNPLGSVQVAAQLGAPKELAAATALAKELGVKLHFHILEDPASSPEDDFKALEDAGAFALGRTFSRHTPST
jgi:5-methylthioadenosine/S-adenosylhomocysteine deaminase